MWIYNGRDGLPEPARSDPNEGASIPGFPKRDLTDDEFDECAQAYAATWPEAERAGVLRVLRDGPEPVEGVEPAPRLYVRQAEATPTRRRAAADESTDTTPAAAAGVDSGSN